MNPSLATASQDSCPDFTVLPTVPTNVIFTGVAGTGKTHQLQQLQRLYDEPLETLQPSLFEALLKQTSWREVVCAVLLLENRALKVAEIAAHTLLQKKANANGRTENIVQTIWGVLLPYSATDSTTVDFKGGNRASQSYFDQTSDKAWYLLEDGKAELSENLQELLSLYRSVSTTATTTAVQVISRTSFVSFHQAYGYEEFVEGIRPAVGGQGQMSYQIQPGAFLRLCQRAMQDPEHRYAMLIDEINRANVARVFGELMSLIEPSKRAGQADAMQVTLAYSNKVFSVPSNVDIYATMNVQDHSLLALDTAFRRRFHFIDCPPKPELLPVLSIIVGDEDEDAKAVETIEVGRILAGLNLRLCQVLGQDSQLGHAYFMGLTDLAQLQQVLVQQIVPQLAQATGSQVETLRYLFNDSEASSEQQFIQASPSQSLSDRHAAHTNPTVNPAGLSSPMGAMGMRAGFWLNPDFISLSGLFRTALPYQRLYP